MTKKQNGVTRYAFYSRCSSDDQKHKDFSTTDVQDKLNREYIQSKGGIIAGAYKDEAVSGTTLKRKGFQQLLADAQAQKFDAVIVTYMSRLGRGKAFVNAEYELEKCGVRVEMVKEKFTDDIGGYMGKNMTNVMDGMYAFQVRGWTMTKMEEMVKAGFLAGGPAPFGMMIVVATDAAGFHRAGNEPPKRLVPDLNTAPVVCRAYDLFIESRSQAAVREYLNAVTTRRWTTTQVKRLLTNEAYKGVQQFGQWRNDDCWTPVVEPETWEAVQEALGQPGRRSGRAETADDYIYYLRDRVVCPHCGCSCTQASHHGKTTRVHYYVCQNANRREPCPIKRVNADRLHATVLHYLSYTASHWTVMRKLISESGGWGSADEAQKALRGQLGKQRQALEMRIANFVKNIGDGRDSPALLAALDKAEAEKEAVCLQMEQANQEIAQATIPRPTTGQVQEAWSQAVRIWKVLTEEERADLMGSFVQVVELTEKESVTLELLPVSHSPSSYSDRFALNSQMGAGVGLEPTTYGL